jgi:hypothetical protein
MDAASAPPTPFTADGELALASVQQLFFLPGDWAIYLLARYVAPLANALGVGPADYGGAYSACLSLIGWSLVVIALIVAVGAVRDFDRRLTQAIGAAYREACRRVRLLLVLARHRRGRRHVRPEPAAVELTEEPDLGRNELRVLQVHANVAPGFALAKSDIAALLKARVHELETALERLQRLALLESTVGGLDDETAYTLTPTGRAVLLARAQRRA